MSIDFGRAADDYAKHRAGFPDSLWDRLAPFDIGTPGQRVVDVGTGTGTLARGFARRGCDVIGIDPSEPMLTQARVLAPDIDFRVGTAEATGLDGASVDVFTAGQCWHWFDRRAAVREALRVLVHGGAIAICHFDWIPQPGNVAEATERLILEHNPSWRGAGGLGMYPRWAADVGDAGFTRIETFSYDVGVLYSRAAWLGRIRASAGVAASTMPPEKVATFDATLAEILAERFPDDPLSVLHRVWALVARVPTHERQRD